jgi:hypothetical protein
LSSYEHKKLTETISQLDAVPDDIQGFSEWIKAEGHLEFLRQNALANEVAVLVSGPYSFVHSVVVSNDRLSPVDQADLMGWNFNSYIPLVGYTTGGDQSNVSIERGMSDTGSKTLDGATQLVFGRTFEGWTGQGRAYYEVHQEYAHLTAIHWRPEERAYCRFDEHGDLESIVSITTREDKGSNRALVSFTWEPLEEYLAASNASLVRMFDFTLWRQSDFSGWSGEQPQKVYGSDDLFYHRVILPSHAAYTRGVQIVRPLRSEKVIFTSMTDRWFGRNRRKYAEFVAHDWRHNRIVTISTDPSATTNYFDAVDNELPFELSPAFFRPEVLLKYKADRDKYTVSERSISCRTSWHLEGIDVNEAGQVHAYICDLRKLPYTEQLHWLSFNEQPKSSISQRAITHDFKGEWAHFPDPLQELVSIIRRWNDDKVAWWTLREEKLIQQVSTPLSQSRDEWAESFMDLAKLVVEGFETKPIRAKLDIHQVSYNKDEKTIVLLEKLLNRDGGPDEPQKLHGLRTVQLLRSKAKGHASGRDAEDMARQARTEHGTYSNHFQSICGDVARELEQIEQAMSSD